MENEKIKKDFVITKDLNKSKEYEIRVYNKEGDIIDYASSKKDFNEALEYLVKQLTKENIKLKNEIREKNNLCLEIYEKISLSLGLEERDEID